MYEYTEMEKCTIYTWRGDRCEIKCRLGLWSVEGPYGLALINEAAHYFRQYREDGEYNELLSGNGSAGITG
jgi:hypothetical protein